MARERFNKPGAFLPFMPRAQQLPSRMALPMLRPLVAERVVRRPGSERAGMLPSVAAGRRYYRSEA